CASIRPCRPMISQDDARTNTTVHRTRRSAPRLMLAQKRHLPCVIRRESRLPTIVRIRIVQKPTEGCVDGIDLVSFEINAEYEVGSLIGSLLLAEGWAQPVDPAPPPSAVAWPLDIEYTTRPPNLIRE